MKKSYAICRNGRFLTFTKWKSKYDAEFFCWYLFCKQHENLGGNFKTNAIDFIAEAKSLGFEIKEYEEKI